jgi:cell division protein FtsI (penicillin-binding protein 3)
MTGQPRTRRSPNAGRVLTRSGDRIAVRRIRWLLGIYGLILLVVFGQLVHIQVVQADEYAGRSVRQRERTVDLPAARGRIYDRDGDVLATSVEGAAIYADPRAYRGGETSDGEPIPPAAEPAEVAAELAPILGRDVDDLIDRLERDAHFVYLARQLDHEVAERIRQLRLPGVGVLAEPKRVYPGGVLAAQVVGFTGIDGDGLQGLEAHYDSVLRGQPGTLFIERAPGGLDIASGVRELVPSEVGTDIVLTLDRDIQHAAEVAVAEAVERFDARAATVVALEVATGEVLAMASTPGFDPNSRNLGDEDAWRNRAITDVFEPGSTQKALTIAAALEEGTVTPITRLEVQDRIRVGSSTFSDAYPHPDSTWTVTEIMERSSNVGTIQVAQELGGERLDAYLRGFGLGSTTGLRFPGESPGMLMDHDQWWGSSLPTIAIGHGVAVTLMQLANAYATLANDGVAVQPSIVRGTVGTDGRLSPTPGGMSRRVVSEETARQVQEMLIEAVSGENGTGARAMVPGYSVAGKTGTARKPAADGGYSDRHVATFAGFAPAHDPQIVVAVMVDEPYPYWGGVVAAPVFSEVMEAALIARRIPPDGTSPSLSEALVQARIQLEELQAAAEASEEIEEDLGIPVAEPASPPAGDPASD